MSIHYKFKSSPEYHTITFSGDFLLLADLKARILAQRKLEKSGDSDLRLFNSQTGEEYTTDDFPIPRNTSLVVLRSPAGSIKMLSAPPKTKTHTLVGSSKVSSDKYAADGSSKIPSAPASISVSDRTTTSLSAVSKPPNPASASVPSTAAQPSSASTITTTTATTAATTAATTNNTTITTIVPSINDNAAAASSDALPSSQSEDERIKWLVSQAKEQFVKSGPPRQSFRKLPPPPDAVPPPGYVCYRCHKPGHFIQYCPSNEDTNLEYRRARKPTGIPVDRLQPVEAGTSRALLHPAGGFAVLKPDEEAFESARPVVRELEVEASMPSELKCPLCKLLLKEPVLIPCCFETLCDPCIRPVLSVPPMKCPQCGTEKVSASALVPNNEVRQAVEAHKKKLSLLYGKGRAETAEQQEAEMIEQAHEQQLPQPNASEKLQGEKKVFSEETEVNVCQGSQQAQQISVQESLRIESIDSEKQFLEKTNLSKQDQSRAPEGIVYVKPPILGAKTPIVDVETPSIVPDSMPAESIPDSSYPGSLSPLSSSDIDLDLHRSPPRVTPPSSPKPADSEGNLKRKPSRHQHQGEERGFKRGKERTCYYCGQPGHVAADCTMVHAAVPAPFGMYPFVPPGMTNMAAGMPNMPPGIPNMPPGMSQFVPPFVPYPSQNSYFRYWGNQPTSNRDWGNQPTSNRGRPRKRRYESSPVARDRRERKRSRRSSSESDFGRESKKNQRRTSLDRGSRRYRRGSSDISDSERHRRKGSHCIETRHQIHGRSRRCDPSNESYDVQKRRARRAKSPDLEDSGTLSRDVTEQLEKSHEKRGFDDKQQPSHVDKQSFDDRKGKPDTRSRSTESSVPRLSSSKRLRSSSGKRLSSHPRVKEQSASYDVHDRGKVVQQPQVRKLKKEEREKENESVSSARAIEDEFTAIEAPITAIEHAGEKPKVEKAKERKHRKSKHSRKHKKRKHSGTHSHRKKTDDTETQNRDTYTKDADEKTRITSILARSETVDKNRERELQRHDKSRVGSKSHIDEDKRPNGHHRSNKEKRLRVSAPLSDRYAPSPPRRNADEF